ncbi:MAG: YkgJ family cysteine cluster protein [Kiritimatiellae bacterium]|nr:YkgJ family cysteine cluster protein [Kiritimatiellia bacterium]MDD5520708.1 YkgJ family cysteine cluster protein [Kiritimatiellia bacterium]
MNKTCGDTNFSCQRCGTCCRWSGHVLLTQQDIKTLSSTLGMNENNFIQCHTNITVNRAQLSLTEQADGACCFLTENNLCSVYASRPQQCRDFPHGWHVSGCPQMHN